MSVVQTERPPPERQPTVRHQTQVAAVQVAAVQVATLAAGPVVGLRLLPAPASEPPYDDLRFRPALRLVPNGDVPARSPSRAGVVGVAAGGGPAGTLTSSKPVAGALPPSRPFAHALVQRLLEVSAGVRPLSQLQRDTTPELFQQLERAFTARPRAVGLRPTGRDVRSVHVQERPEGVAEVCATVLRGHRAAAVALRLECVHGRWLCTQLAGV